MNNNYSNLLILAECILSGLLSMYGNMFFFIIIYSKDNILLLYICFSFLRNFKHFINSLFNLCMRPWKYLFRVVRITQECLIKFHKSLFISCLNFFKSQFSVLALLHIKFCSLGRPEKCNEMFFPVTKLLVQSWALDKNLDLLGLSPAGKSG